MATAPGAQREAVTGGQAPASVPSQMTEGLPNRTPSSAGWTAVGVPQTPSGSYLQGPTPTLSTWETSHSRDHAAGLAWLRAGLPTLPLLR